jgi:parafibromin
VHIAPADCDPRFSATIFIMASAADLDGLVLLRQSISSNAPFIPSASADASATEVPLSQATHLRFPNQDVAVPIDNPTRFVSHDKPVDLRSIYFAWLNREVAIPEYNASATKLNDELAVAGGSGKVQNLGFIERLDLITWLEGASEESEYIKPLASDKDAATAGAATTAATGAVSSATQARSGRGTMDPRLVGIYNGERRMGDRNTVLRGNKPTVCIFTSTSD